jgi:hypothetical protein
MVSSDCLIFNEYHVSFLYFIIMKIAYLINGAISLKTVTNTISKFPNAYVYVLNTSFELL